MFVIPCDPLFSDVFGNIFRALRASAHISWHISRVEQELTSNLAGGPSDVPRCVLWKKWGKWGGNISRIWWVKPMFDPKKWWFTEKTFCLGAMLKMTFMGWCVSSDVSNRTEHGMLKFIHRITIIVHGKCLRKLMIHHMRHIENHAKVHIINDHV